MKRSSIVALVVVGLTALCVGAVRLGATPIGPGTILGCDTDPTRRYRRSRTTHVRSPSCSRASASRRV